MRGSDVGALDRVNVVDVDLAPTVAHGGDDTIGVARIAETGDLAGPCNFIDVAELPPGTSIGRHRHADDEEELYLVLAGRGLMWRDGEEFEVRPGDLVRNRPGGAHGLRNPGPDALRLFVVELACPTVPGGAER